MFYMTRIHAAIPHSMHSTSEKRAICIASSPPAVGAPVAAGSSDADPSPMDPVAATAADPDFAFPRRSLSVSKRGLGSQGFRYCNEWKQLHMRLHNKAGMLKQLHMRLHNKAGMLKLPTFCLSQWQMNDEVCHETGGKGHNERSRRGPGPSQAPRHQMAVYCIANSSQPPTRDLRRCLGPEPSQCFFQGLVLRSGA